MGQRWSRDELSHVVAARRGKVEGQGDDAFVVMRLKVTPELLESMLGGYWTNRLGERAEFDGLTIDDDGFVEPLFHYITRPMA